MYIADGLKGITIVNITDPTQPNLISSFPLGGWAYRVNIFSFDKLALIA